VSGPGRSYFLNTCVRNDQAAAHGDLDESPTSPDLFAEDEPGPRISSAPENFSNILINKRSQPTASGGSSSSGPEKPANLLMYPQRRLLLQDTLITPKKDSTKSRTGILTTAPRRQTLGNNPKTQDLVVLENVAANSARGKKDLRANAAMATRGESQVLRLSSLHYLLQSPPDRVQHAEEEEARRHRPDNYSRALLTQMRTTSLAKIFHTRQVGNQGSCHLHRTTIFRRRRELRRRRGKEMEIRKWNQDRGGGECRWR
jgi:hypothetical protein